MPNAQEMGYESQVREEREEEGVQEEERDEQV
jgi:hypothetical protein